MRKTIRIEIEPKRSKKRGTRGQPRVIYADLKSENANGIIKRLTAKYGLRVRTVEV